MKCLRSCGFLVALIALSLIGCPGTTGPQQQDETEVGQVKKLVQLFSDMARDPKTFEDQFASGKAPDEKMRQRYGQWYRTWIVEPADPTIEGDRATIPIEIFSKDDPATVVETLTWTAVKQGDQWLLEDTPLPASAK